MSLERPVNAEALKAALRHGAANGKSANTLAFELDTTPRAIRQLVDDCIVQGVPVCAHPTTGYFIAETQAEVDECAEFLRNRAMHGLKKSSDLKTAFYNYVPPAPVQPIEQGTPA